MKSGNQFIFGRSSNYDSHTIQNICEDNRPKLTVDERWYQQQLKQAHVMPQPTQTAWTPCNMSWAVASNDISHDRYDIMHFGAHTTHNVKSHCKRKSDSLMLQPPTKQFISEEKITAHFNELHISSNSNQCDISDLETGIAGQCGMTIQSTNSVAFNNLNLEVYQLNNSDLQEKLQNATAIVLNEQVRKLRFSLSSMPTIPETIYKLDENSCTALIPYVSPLTTLQFGRGADLADEITKNNTSMDSKVQKDDKMDLEES